MTQFVTTFFIVLGAYLFCLLAFSIVKFIFKRKDQKANKNKEVQQDEEDIKDDD